MARHNLFPPFRPDDLKDLAAGDEVLISGQILTARDAAHLRLVAALKNHQPLPFDLKGQLIYYLGPSPAPPGRPMGAAGPTTSGRMDPLTPPILEAGALALLGKGPRDAQVKEALMKNRAVYLAALGGAGALLGKCVTRAETIAYPDLGPEAILRLTVFELPAVVIIDQKGKDWYNIGPAQYRNIGA